VRIEPEVPRRREGSTFAAECTGLPIRDAGQIVGAVIGFVDITEPKRAEAVPHSKRVELERCVSERIATPRRARRRSR
jgi:hypothetical protein